MGWYSRLANVLRSDRLSRELDAELAFHVAERIDELVAGGMSPEAARTEALRRFGNYPLQRERTRDMDITRWLEAFVGDLTHAVRQLRVNPGFTAVAVLSLTLGIGANTAIFQLINVLRIRSLPVHEPSKLVAVDVEKGFYQAGWYASRHRAFTHAQYTTLRREQQAFDDVLAFGTARFNLTPNGEARYAQGLYVSSNFLDVLGVRPAFGGSFPENVDGPDCSGAGVLLNYAFWQREHGGDPAAIGREMYVHGRILPIVGVTPPEFFGIEPGRRFDLAVPICADALFSSDGKGRLARLDAWWLTLVGRLKPGWTEERASAHLRALSPALFRATLPPSYRPDEAEQFLKNTLKGSDASAGLSSLRREYENPLLLLLAVTGLVLLIACANLANLLLARASARQREMAVRQAIGASRWRLVQQLGTESLLLAAVGAACGLVAAQVLSRLLVAFLTHPDQPIEMALAIDRNVFGFAALLGILTSLLFGVAPAIKATSDTPAAAMQGARGSTQLAERHRFRRLLIVSQVALSLVLLVGALLFGQTLRNLLTIDPGIVPEGVLVAGVDARVPELTSEHRRVVFDEMERRIAAQPGVVAVAQVSLSPFGGSEWNGRVHAHGADATREPGQSWFNAVGPGYFETLRTPVLAGRDFDARDRPQGPKVAIVNEEFSRTFFGGRNPVGRSFRIDVPVGDKQPVYEIVGLVKNTKYTELREEFRPIAFLLISQDSEPSDSVTFLVRSQALLASIMAGIRHLTSEMPSGLLVEFRVLDVQVSQSVLRERLMASVSGASGVLGTLLSMLGLYGVRSYIVTHSPWVPP